MPTTEVKNENLCCRCNKLIYDKERFGPIMGSVYHKSCFNCSTCGVRLLLVNYSTNRDDPKDKQVYCRTHSLAVNRMSSNVNKNVNKY